MPNDYLKLYAEQASKAEDLKNGYGLAFLILLGAILVLLSAVSYLFFIYVKDNRAANKLLAEDREARRKADDLFNGSLKQIELSIIEQNSAHELRHERQNSTIKGLEKDNERLRNDREKDNERFISAIKELTKRLDDLS